MNGRILTRALIFLITMMSLTGLSAQSTFSLKWKYGHPIPAVPGTKVQPGLAGAVVGISNGQLIVAGGANFGDTLPWKGGIKKYHDEIYLLNLQKGNAKWKRADTPLPAPIAYSACAAFNNEVFSIGGEGPAGLLDNVYSLSWGPDGGLINAENPLPEKISSAGAAVIGNQIYVAGGTGTEGASRSVWRTSLGARPLQWQKITDLPSPLSHPLVIAQHDGKETCLFVIGGRNKTGRTSTFFSTVWKYVPSKNRWEPSGELTGQNYEPMGLSAGTGVPVGDRYILIIGGDVGKIFNRTEELIAQISETSDAGIKEKLTSVKNSNLENHPGFSRHVLRLDCQTGLIQPLTEVKMPLPVTTTAVIHDNIILIPSGEIRPGVRTPGLLKATIK